MTEPERHRSAVLFVFSLSVHLAILLIAVAVIDTARPLPAPKEPEAIDVQLIEAASEQQPEDKSPRDFEKLAKPQAVTTAPALPEDEQLAPSGKSEPAPSLDTVKPDELPRVKQIFANRILASQKGTETKTGLLSVHLSERTVQLCNLEALEQIAHAYPELSPKTVMADATLPLREKGLNLKAPGALVYANGTWYSLEFECWIRPDALELDDFAFKLGAELPRPQWGILNLPDEMGH